jgi:TolA-binding protein
MNSNRLHNIFGSKSRLSREDISKYGNTKDPNVKHHIEMKSTDSFESDAMEGWEALSYNTSIMTSLDKKFATKSNFGIYLAATVSILGIVSLLFFLNREGAEEAMNTTPQQSENITTLMENQEITLEQSDVVLPQPIEEMEIAPIEEQVKIEDIKDDFKEMNTNYEPEEPIVIEMLPIFDVIPEPIEPEIIREHNYGKEIYLQDFKLVDYRKYRSKPAVKTKQIVLSGTPANMEGRESSEIEPEYKVIDIPYIEYIEKSMSRFSKGSYKNALSRFENILSTYSDDVNANFYAGLCLFNLKEYKQAIQSFNSCINGPYSNFDEESQWMIALSYEKLGKTEKAQEYFSMIIEQGGFYKKQAQGKMK